MKPNFALGLSHDGIALLHRSATGWLIVGEVSLDEEAFSETLGYLRTTALGLEPHGLSTKLILPDSEVLYTRVHAPGPGHEAQRAQIAAALEGMTPYSVAELAFDWTGPGPEVQVAAVARETLEEAENFALEHRFNPVSFVARPESGTYDGEPFFGATESALAKLPGGAAAIERDNAPVTITGRSESPPRGEPARAKTASPQARVSATASQPDPKPQPKSGHEHSNAGDRPVVTPLHRADAGQLRALPGTASEASAAPVVRAESRPSPTPVVAFSTRRSVNTDALSKSTEPTEQDILPAGRISLPRFPGDQARAPGADPHPGVLTRLRALVARGQPTATSEPEAAPRAIPLKPVETKIPRPVRTQPFATEASTSEADALTVFGARKTQDTPRSGRRIGLLLAGAILLLLGAVAVWAAYFIAPTPPVTRDTTDQAPAIAEVPDTIAAPDRLAVTPEPDTPMQSTEPTESSPPLSPPAEDAGPTPSETAPDAPQVAAVPQADAPQADAPDGISAVARAIEEALAADLDASAPDQVPGSEPSALDSAPPDTAALEATPDAALPGAELWASAPATGPEPRLSGTSLPPFPQPDPSVSGADTVPRPEAPQELPDSAPTSLPSPAPAPTGQTAPGADRSEDEVTIEVVSGPPPFTPQARGDTLPEGVVIALPGADPALADVRPEARPQNIPQAVQAAIEELLNETSGEDAPTQAPQPEADEPPPPGDQGAAPEELVPATPGAVELTALRAAARPADLAAAVRAEPEETSSEVVSQSPLAVSVSYVPAPRPESLVNSVRQALAAQRGRATSQSASAAPAQASSAPAPAAPATAAPSSIPTRASVAEQATQSAAINLRRLNLLGVFGTQNQRRALVRLSNGQVVRVRVGDRLDGGQVSAIGDNELRYIKSGRNHVLTIGQSG